MCRLFLPFFLEYKKGMHSHTKNAASAERPGAEGPAGQSRTRPAGAEPRAKGPAVRSSKTKKQPMSYAARCRRYRAKRDLMFIAFPDKKQVFLARVSAQRRRCRESRGLRVRRLEPVGPVEPVNRQKTYLV